MVVPEHDPRITTWLHAYTPSNASTDVDGNANVTVVDTSPEAMEKVQELEIGGEHLVEDIQRNVRRWNRLKEEGKLGLHSVSSATEGVSSSSSKKGN